MPKGDDIISVSEAATELGVSGRQVLNLIAAGLLPTKKKFGRSHMIRRADLAKVPKVRKPGPRPKGK